MFKTGKEMHGMIHSVGRCIAKAQNVFFHPSSLPKRQIHQQPNQDNHSVQTVMGQH
jgi:hypothetical protein